MTRLLPLLASVCLIGYAWSPRAAAQDAGAWHVSAGGTFVQPTLGLADRFGSHVTGFAGIGHSDNGRLVEARLERFAFTQGTVTLLADTTGPAIDVAQLDMALTLTGGSLRLQQRVGQFGPAKPFLGGGAGLYFWEERRVAYADSFRTIPALTRPSQWSAGFEVGAGVDLALTRSATVSVGGSYHVVMGELWPTLNLGLESVSTFQFATASASVRYAF